MSLFTEGQKRSTLSSDFDSILEATLSKYKEKSGSGLLEYPLAEQVKRCDAIDAISAILKGQAREFQQFRAFPPTGAVFTDIGALLSAGKDVKATHGALVELLFKHIESFFKRLGVYTQVSLATELGEVFVKIVTEVLSILFFATEEVKRKRAKIYFRKLLGRSLRKDIEDTLKKLDSLLVRAEVRMAITQTLKATNVGDMFEPESSWDETFRLWMEERGVNGNVHDMYETILLHSAAYQGTPEVVGTLLNRGLKSNAKNSWGETVLHSVSRGKQGSQGGVRVAKLLLERGADVNTRRNDHQTPLHVASYFGSVEIVRLLLDHGADLEAAWGDMGEKPLHQVSYGKYRSQEDGVRVAQLLFDRGADVNTRRKDDWTPLHHASYFGNVEIVRLLLDHGADLDAATGNMGDKPLHQLSYGKYRSQEDGVRVAQLLFDRGADVNTRGKNDRTPLHHASYYGNIEIVRLLLDHGADLEANAEGNYGEKPLHKVSYGKYRSQQDGVRVAQLLLDRGADVNTRRKDHQTPLHLASYFGNVEIVRLLLEHGADLESNAVGHYGEKPLHSLSYGKSREEGVHVAQLLLERGADVNTRRSDHWTPLHLASHWRKLDLVRLLIHHGAEVKAVDDFGMTPLHEVSKGNHESQENGVRVAQLLLDHGADVNAKTKFGYTPLALASNYKMTKLANLFKRVANVRVGRPSADLSQAT